MLEGFWLLAGLGPGWVGLLLFPIGLCVGSFCTVLSHRLPRGESVVAPRSRCPRCEHPLGAGDLVPLLSFFWHNGRCQYCAAPVSWRYPALELGCGLTVGLAGLAAGWMGGLAVGALWVGGAFFWARFQPRAETGATLVEILVAVGLLVAVAIPMLDLGAHMRGATPFQRQIAVSLAASRVEELGNRSYRTIPWPSSDTDVIMVGRFLFDIEWTISAFSPTVNDFGSESSQLKQATVTVTCSNCTRPMTPVRMVAILAKL